MGFKLVYGPANSGKTGYIYKEYKKEVVGRKSPLLVLPGQADVFRSSKELSKELQSMIGGSVLTFGNLFNHVISMTQKQPELVSPVQRLVLLKKSVVETDLDLLLASSKYSGFLEKISKTIGDLISCGLTPGQLEKLIHSGQLDNSLAIEELNKVYAGYMSNLERNGLTEYNQLGFFAIESLDSMPPGRNLFIHKFEEFSLCEKKFIEQYSRINDVTSSYSYDETKLFCNGDKVFGWLGALAGENSVCLKSNSANYSNKALFAIERNMFSKQRSEPATGSSGIFLMTGAGIHNEVELAGSQIARLIKGPGPETYKPNEIAVIVRDRSYQSEIIRVFRQYNLPVGIKAGYRMQETNFGRSFLALYRGLVNRQKKDLLEFFRSEFSHMPADKFSHLEKTALSGRRDHKYLLGILLSDETLNSSIRSVRSSELRKKIQGLLELAAGMIDGYLKRTGSRTLVDNDSRALDLNAYTVITGALESLEKVFHDDQNGYGEISDKELINLISRLNVQMTEKPEEERIQVLSPHEARGRRFKVVFVLGLNEGSYPGRPAEDPFISNSVRNSLRRLGFEDLQTNDFNPAEEMKLFYMLVTRARNQLYLGYCFADDKGSQRLRSNYLTGLLDLFTGEAKNNINDRLLKKELKDIIFRSIEDCPGASEIKRTIAHEGIDSYDRLPDTLSAELKFAKEKALNTYDHNGLQLEGLVERHFGAGRIIGVTEVERYIKCHYKWFAENALKIRPLFEEFSKADIGKIFHKIAAETYRSLKWENINDRSEMPVEEMIITAGQIADAELRTIDLPATETLLVKDMLITLLRNTFNLDKERGGTYFPKYLEQPFGYDADSFPAFSTQSAEGFSFAGRIDRIDVCETSKQAVIVDYKTGSPPRQFNPLNYLQIVLYALAAKKALLENEGIETVAAEFQYPKQGKTKTILLQQASIPGLPAEKVEFGQLADEILHSVSEAVASLGEGDISPNADDCKFCDLDQICRRRAN